VVAHLPLILGFNMAENNGVTLFGFEIKRKKDTSQEKLQSIVPPTDQDGAGYVTAAGAHYGTYVNLGGEDHAKDNLQNIRQYRAVATHPEVDAAIEDIVNESVISGEGESSISLTMDKVEGLSESLKKQINEEFENVVSMLNFNDLGHDIFRRWYVDGRIYHHLVVDEKNLKLGIQEIRPVDATKIRKVKEVKKKKDPVTGASLIDNVNEFYIYQEKPGGTNQGVKLSTDSVSYVTSGLLDVDRKRVVSHLHKALKPINQLRMMEDSLVIYRLARAPERRIFYIDVGNLPRGKAETYMKDIMARYRNKLVYDADTGKIRDDRKHMSMLEDFWLPRREGGRGTEISTLPGGENLGQIDDIIYFQKRLYRSLNVFVDRLRNRFGMLFTEILKKQLIMKGLITEEDWDQWKNDVSIDYIRDNHFTELKDAELLANRLQTLDQVQQYVGEFFSKEYVMKNILMLDDDGMKQMKDQIAKETQAGEINNDEDEDQ